MKQILRAVHGLVVGVACVAGAASAWAGGSNSGGTHYFWSYPGSVKHCGSILKAHEELKDLIIDPEKTVKDQYGRLKSFRLGSQEVQLGYADLTPKIKTLTANGKTEKVNGKLWGNAKSVSIALDKAKGEFSSYVVKHCGGYLATTGSP